jgi:hypothetical protein
MKVSCVDLLLSVRRPRTKSSGTLDDVCESQLVVWRSVARAMTTPANAPTMLHTTSVVAGKREWLNSWDTSAASDRTAAKPTTVEAA